MDKMDESTQGEHCQRSLNQSDRLVAQQQKSGPSQKDGQIKANFPWWAKVSDGPTMCFSSSREQRAASSEKRKLMMKLRGRLVKDELKASLEKVQFKVGGVRHCVKNSRLDD